MSRVHIAFTPHTCRTDSTLQRIEQRNATELLSPYRDALCQAAGCVHLSLM